MSDSDGTTFTPITELEGALRGPDGIATADALVTRIDQLVQEIETYKSSAPSPADYSRVETINKALAAARGIVLGIRSINSSKEA